MKLPDLNYIYESFPGQYISIKDSLIYFNINEMDITLSKINNKIILRHNKIEFTISNDNIDVFSYSNDLSEKIVNKDIKFFEDESLAKLYAGFTDKPFEKYENCEKCPYYTEEDMGYFYHKPYFLKKCQFLETDLTDTSKKQCKENIKGER